MVILLSKLQKKSIQGEVTLLLSVQNEIVQNRGGDQNCLFPRVKKWQEWSESEEEESEPENKKFTLLEQTGAYSL